MGHTNSKETRQDKTNAKVGAAASISLALSLFLLLSTVAVHARTPRVCVFG